MPRQSVWPRFRISYTAGFVSLAAIVWLMGLVPLASAADKISVVVSILPEKFFVDHVGGSHVEVSVMVGPGQSPATYEPTPKQLTALAAARVYFRIGAPFETVWMSRIRAANRSMLVVNVAQDVKLRSAGVSQFLDPHVWTSPVLAKRISARIEETLMNLDPAHKVEYEHNYAKLADQLDTLDAMIRARLSSLKQRAFLTFHPAWGYFAGTYGLRQIAIEREGKEPGAQTLLHVIEEAKRLNIKVIFVEPQFSRRTAEMVAREIGGRVVTIDPLAENYIDNMRKVAAAVAGASAAK